MAGEKKRLLWDANLIQAGMKEQVKTAVWWEANSWNRTVNYACFSLALSLQSESCFGWAKAKAKKKKKRKRKRKRTLGGDNLFTSAAVTKAFSRISEFHCNRPPWEKQRSFHPQWINMKSFAKSDGLEITTSRECLNNVHGKFMQVIEGLYSELSVSAGLDNWILWRGIACLKHVVSLCENHANSI